MPDRQGREDGAAQRARVVLRMPRGWEESVLWLLREGGFGPAAAEEEFPSGCVEGEEDLAPRREVRVVLLARRQDRARLESWLRDLAERLAWPGDAWGWTWEERDEEDWDALWRRRWRPFRIGHLVVAPDFQPPAALPLREGDRLLRLQTGSAFGTGRHATTRLALRFLQACFRARKPPRTVLDVGTGTGILAVAAARLGATRVAGLDPDPASPAQAAATAALNGLAAPCRFWRGRLESAGGLHDLVLANLQAELLCAGASRLRALLRPSGHLVAGGILAPRVERTRHILRSEGLKVQDMGASGAWRVLLMAPG